MNKRPWTGSQLRRYIRGLPRHHYDRKRAAAMIIGRRVARRYDAPGPRLPADPVLASPFLFGYCDVLLHACKRDTFFQDPSRN